MPITSSTVGTTTTFTPAEILYDPTNKLRVAQPESLIDTDFEYGQQTTKWENLATVNNMPFARLYKNILCFQERLFSFHYKYENNGQQQIY